ncbi:uncharacterized protein METZ01_LOCUS324837 [marine metagenome]|uniref:Uncharacterized protein n=1 Tax=marine metagenome TaxID=408172 RepID=A0A382PF07_9ZZZZ
MTTRVVQHVVIYETSIARTLVTDLSETGTIGGNHQHRINIF